MPTGLLVTVPLPVPDLLTLNTKVWALKSAMTEVAAVMSTVHVPVPEHPAPLQPVKVDPVSAVAVNETLVLDGNEYEQDDPQSIPVGLLITVPLPVPPLLTFNVYEVDMSKLAVTEMASVMLTVQTPVPVQPPPLHPVNVDPLPATAVRVT